MIRGIAVASVALLLGACAGFEAAACGGPDDAGVGQAFVLPERMAGLRVEREKAATKELNVATDPDDTYQCPGEAAVYSLRDGKELRAVLQISRLAPDARMDDREFLSGLVRGITGSILEPIELGGVDVYRTTSVNEQFTTTWFQDRFMLFLTVREDQAFVGQAVGVDFANLVEAAVALRPAVI